MDGIRTVVRAFELLEAFRESRQPMRLREAVDLTGYPSSSVADLLKTLTQLGYLNFDRRSQSYFPTPRLATLGSWIEGALFDDSHVTDAMQSVSDATREAVLLGTANELEVQYLRTMQSTHPVRYVTNPGARRPLICSGLGFALLMLEDDATVERIYRASPARDRRSITLAALREKMDEGRRTGIIYSRNTVHEGVSTLSAPLRGFAPMGRRIAMGIAGPTDRMDANLARYTRAMLDAVTAFGGA